MRNALSGEEVEYILTSKELVMNHPDIDRTLAENRRKVAESLKESKRIEILQLRLNIWAHIFAHTKSEERSMISTQFNDACRLIFGEENETKT